MNEDFYVEESNPRNVKIAILVGVFVVVLLIVGFLYLSNSSKIKVRKNMELEIGTEISNNPLDYINNKNIDVNDLDLVLTDVPIENNIVNKIGEYTFTIYYNNKATKGKLSIVDHKAPIVETTNITIGVGEEFDLDDLISKCDDQSKPCDVTLKDESDEDKFKTEGEYEVTLVIKDLAGNKTEASGKVTVKKGYSRESLKKSDLNISYIEPIDDNWNKSMMIKFDEAVNPDKFDSDAKYEQLLDLTSEDFSIYLPEDYKNNSIKDTEIYYVYNKYDYIIGFAVKVTLDNGKILYLTK